MRKMKVIHYLVSLDFGGLQHLVVELVKQQKRDGLDVSVMCNSSDGAYYKALVDNKIKIFNSKIDSGFDVKYTTYLRLKNIFNRSDILHIHCFSAILLYAAIDSNARTVYTIHGLSKGMRRNTVLNMIREKIKSILLKRVDYFIANSSYTLNRAKNDYNLKKVSSKKIYNGIQIPKNINKSTKKDDIFTIGLISRFNYSKRIDIAIRCFEKFREVSNEGKLILIGDGESYNDIEKLVKSSKHKSDISLLGYKKNVHNYYPLFDISIFPAFGEGFGLTAIECYMHGISVLAFDDSGGLKK